MPETEIKINFNRFERVSLRTLGVLLIFLSVFQHSPAYAKKCDLVKTIQAITPVPAAKPIVLFEGLGRPGKGYKELVEKLKPGDVIQFGDSSQNTIHAVLGNGDTAKVLDVGGGEAIRIPIDNDERGNNVFNEFVKEHRFLKEAGVPIVEMNAEKNIPFQKISVSQEKFRFTLHDYLYGNAAASLSKDQKKTIEEKLVEFARKTWAYKMMGDFGTHQMGFTQKGEWIIFDAARSGALMQDRPLFNLKDTENIFSPFKVPSYGISDDDLYGDVLPSKLYKKTQAAIEEERKFQRKHGSWLKRNEYVNTNLINHMTPDPIPEGRKLTREMMIFFGQRHTEGNGLYSTSPEVSMTILKHLQDEKGVGTYQVKLPTGKTALLKLLKSEDADSQKQLLKIIKKAHKNKSIIETGSDFVLLDPNFSN